jgi:Ca-activated chloride channel family protein
MNGYWENERKIEIATRLLSETLESLEVAENLELGLRVYGHQTRHIPGKQDCDDTELVVDIGPGRNLVIKQALNRLIPQGTTPIARSLEKAAYDFTPCTNCRNVIILITDGIEACDEDPCAVSRALQAQGVIVKPFIIGIGIDELYKSTFECVGNYFDAAKEETFKRVLNIVVTQALNNTTVQVNLLNANNKPTETNVAYTIYNEHNGNIVHNFVHTLNHKDNPDTLTLDPLLTYKIVAHTIPPVEKSGFTLTPGKHNILALEAPQGDLFLSFDKFRSEYPDLKCIVSKQGSCEMVNIQNYGTKERYIVGSYDLTIQTLPPTFIENVDISQSHTTDVKIPLPGVLLLQTGSPGYGGIYEMKNNELFLVKKFTFSDPSGRYTIQPGKYKVVFRNKNSKQTVYTIEKEFTITSGKNTSLRL